ncbi:MAG: NAD-dependent epimerase/dehydratase family protein [Spirochaetia bacterium]|nr:NAD-dependent epimerase/dehydratase family protein [Spirochaetia bacterium]
MMNPIVESDIKELIQQRKYFEPFMGSTVLVTGATGLLGSLLVKALYSYADTVYACCRNKVKFDSVFDGYMNGKIIPVFSDITELDISDYKLDYIIHTASTTDSKTFVEKPVDTINVAVEGAKNLLVQCIEKKLKGFIYLSSLEVYGSFPGVEGIKNVTEKDFGYLEPVSVRSSYSESKRLVETLCRAYQSQYGVSVKIARLCQTFGAGVQYNDNRVFAQFARSVIEDKDIILKTKGETVRNYCYTTDAITGLLTVLAMGKAGEAYNIANRNTTISIADMAALFCRLYPASGIKVVFDIAEDTGKLGYNPVVKLQLDSAKLEKLGWTASVGLEKMIYRLVESLKSERHS